MISQNVDISTYDRACERRPGPPQHHWEALFGHVALWTGNQKQAQVWRGPFFSPTRYTWASVSCIGGRCKSPASAQLASRNAGAGDVSVLMLLQVLPFISHSTARTSDSREP